MNQPVTWDSTIREFIQKTGSPEPTPGGGSMSALVAGLGAAMISMVGHFTQGEKFADVEEQIANVLAEMSELSQACEALSAADMEAFGRYMQAFRLPKHTEAEREARSRTVHRAAIDSIEIPRRLLGVCRQGLKLTRGITELCNPNVVSDLGIGAILFASAAQSACIVIENNAAGLKDEPGKAGIADHTAVLMKEITVLRDQTLSAVRTRIAARSGDEGD